jgi:hypothetical protein
MKSNRVIERMAAGLAAMLLACAASGQEAPANSATKPAAGSPEAKPTENAKRVETETPKAAPSAPASQEQKQYSPGVGDVLKLLQAGVSKDVIKAFVEHSRVVYQLNAEDVIALKQQGGSDELITAMVKRGAPPAGYARRAPDAAATGSAQPANTPESGLDPESYEFWWYHYAYPRALASANERLLSSYGPYFGYPGYGYSGYGYAPYGYGFYQSLPYQPHAGFVFARPRWR